jgi:hypothetical protein
MVCSCQAHAVTARSFQTTELMPEGEHLNLQGGA